MNQPGRGGDVAAAAASMHADVRTRLHDVAREAGVSLATVDRVVHSRPGVSARTLQRVQQALQRLSDARQPRAACAPGALLCALLPAQQGGFVKALREELEALVPWLRSEGARLEIRTTDRFAPAAAASAVKSLRGQYDALIVMLQDHPLVREAVERTAADGTCVVSLVSRLSVRQRTHFVGIDNLAAGRTAAGLLGRFAGATPGCVGLIMGSHELRDHAERVRSFSERMAVEHPHLRVLEPLECKDRDDLAHLQVRALLARHPDLVGLYSVGAGHGGIGAALQAAGASRRLAWVCHELTAESRAALLDGSACAVIGHSAAEEAQACCRLALSLITRQPATRRAEPIGIHVYTRDNLP